MSVTGINTRSKAKLAEEMTPPSGETTSDTTNTWSNGTGEHSGTSGKISNVVAPVPQPGAPAGEPISKELNPYASGGKGPSKAPSSKAPSVRTLIHNHDSSSQVTVLMAELEVRKAELEIARLTAAAANSKLEIARINDAERSAAGSDAGSQRRCEDWVASHIESQHVRNNERGNLGRENATSRPPRANVHTMDMASRVPYALMAHRPAPELPPFDGNITEWISFRAEFEDSAPSFTDIQNVSRIRKALRGDARIAVKAIMYTVSDPYEIIDALERHFGDPEDIILSEIRNIKKMPRLAEDCSNIVMFASHIANTVATIRALRQNKYLHAPELVNKISDKLNIIIRYEWAKYKQINQNMPDLVAMSSFLNEISVTAKRTHNRQHNKRGHTNTVGRDYVSKPSPRGNAAYAGARSRATDYSPDSSDSDSSSYSHESAYQNHTVATVGNRRDFKKPTQKPPRSKPPPSVQSTATLERNNDTNKCVICNGNHKAADCADFVRSSITERWESVKNAKLCFRCLDINHRRPIKCKYVACGVNGCEAGHHKLLHGLLSAPQTARASVGSISHVSRANTYLKIVPVELIGPLGTVCTYALLDEGSTMTLIERETADAVTTREIGDPLTIEGVGGHLTEDLESCRIKVTIRGQCSRNLEKINAHTIAKLSLDSQEVPRDLLNKCTHLNDIADELCYTRETPTILIGQDNWHLIVSREIRSGDASLPVASLTRLGWVLHGQYDTPTRKVGAINHLRPKTTEDEIFAAMKAHFSIESLGVENRTPKSDPDQRAIDILDATCSKIPGENRFQAGLLWRIPDETLPGNKAQALRRLHSMEQKLDRDASLNKEFTAQVDNLINKGYAEKIDSPPPPNSPRAWYLPFFGTRHSQKGTLRLVFDAKAAAYGTSLNQALLTGPDLLKSLFGVMIRFREGRIGVIADVKEMFLQVSIIEQDRDSLRFLWRGGDRVNPPQEYRMTRLIFGASCSPTTALYVKNKNAEEQKNAYPIAAEKTIRNTYMDDMLIALDHNENEARKIVNDIYELNMKASFELRRFASNYPSVISDVSPKGEDTSVIGGSDTERTLGLIWNHKQDTLGFNVNLRNTPPNVLSGETLPTKRQVTSSAMSIFDPIGYASPISVLGKSLIQDVWRTGIGWDDTITEECKPAWLAFIGNIQKLRDLEIPRYVPTIDRTGDIHVFNDASEKIYATCIYFVSRDISGQLRSNLIAAKARVAPLKTISIPRLELQSCTLGTRLAQSVIEETDYTISNRYFWSDSRTVLAWIKSDPRTFKSFVAHRLAEIEDTTTPADWHWVPSALNIADFATKYIPDEFDSNHRWFRGPEFLVQDRNSWPIEKQIMTPTPPTGEERNKVLVCTTQTREQYTYLPEISRFSKLTRLVRASACVIVAAERLKTKMLTGKCEIEMNNGHIKIAELSLIKRSQSVSFPEERKLLQSSTPLQRKSPLYKIAVKLDKAGIVVLDSRVDRGKTVLPVLHAKEEFSKLLIHHYHEKYNHGNHATVINELKQRYYIIGMRGAIRYICNKCQWCRTYKGAPLKAPVGDLPKERLLHNQPAFTATAIDLFGPMNITIGRRREKRWGVLFTCLTTRAVHLELAASLSASSTILALRRMMARRGAPTVIYTDNGTNFVGSERELREAKKTLPEVFQSNFATSNIIWKKIPPGNPAAGGAWERMVGCVKAALKVTLREKAPHEEVLHTLLLEAEHIVNSRPLTPVNPDCDEEALTPNHFLLSRSNAMSPLGSFKDAEMTLSSWKTAQALADRFWKRWLQEYRPLLCPRSSTYGKHHKPQPGDVVIIADNTMPRGTWPRGIVAKVYPGPDGYVRLADVQTRAGLQKRPTNRLILICSTAECADAREGECRS